MDFGKENFWQIQRKPRFGVDRLKLGAPCLKENNQLDSDSQLDNEDSTAQSHFSSRNLGSCQKNSGSHSMFRKRVDMDKLRAIVMGARVRRDALMKKAEKSGLSQDAEIPVGTLTKHSSKKSTKASSLVSRRYASPECVSSKGNCFPTNTDKNLSSKEYCRTLCFDDIQEVQESEDLTMPLEMMDMTAMISGASVLQRKDQNQNCRQLDYKQCLSSEKRSKIVKTNEAYKAGGSEPFKKFNIPKLHSSSQNDHRKVSSRVPQLEIKIDKNLDKSSKKRVLHRSPVKKKNAKVGSHSDDKIKAKVNTHSNHKMMLRSSQIPDIPNIVICPPDPEPVVENQSNLPEKCDASTNTQILFSLGKSPDNCLIQEAESLVREQEEIIRKAKVLYEQSITRRQQMKDIRLLESFMTSVSPLKRLCSMVAEKPSFLDGASSSCSGSNKVTEEETAESSDHPNNKGFGNTSENQSLLECSIVHTTSDPSLSQHKWKHLKLDSRIFQTPTSKPKKSVKKASPVVSEDEEFKEEIGEDLSPFTEMVGDCERPSLAPMTPHSRHQVSMIKMSLRKQLNQLYE